MYDSIDTSAVGELHRLKKIQMGVVVSGFNLIKPGTCHRANDRTGRSTLCTVIRAD